MIAVVSSCGGDMELILDISSNLKGMRIKRISLDMNDISKINRILHSDTEGIDKIKNLLFDLELALSRPSL